MVRFIDGKNKLVLDVACGTGKLSTFIHYESTQPRIIGTDLTYDYLKLAKIDRVICF